ncbi:MAG: DUF368 domain-containing protein [Planctomycetota bacterium]
MQSEPKGAPAPARTVFGGFLMGFANLVPGISGGTMILAVGLYDRFIGAISRLSRLSFQKSDVRFLAFIGVGAVLAIGSLSGVLVDLVVEHRWIMYSLFLGMTLGGAPELWKQCKPVSGEVVGAFALGFAVMAAFAWLLTGTHLGTGIPVLLVVGALAASSMILPGISGSYLLLIFGLYETVIGCLRPAAWKEDWAGNLRILVPVGIGAVLGVALLSNLLQAFLQRRPRMAHGLLLGLLVGSVLGLWPFQTPVEPELARKETRKVVAQLELGVEESALREKFGEEYTAERLAELRTRYGSVAEGDLKLRGDALQRFRPTWVQALSALGIFVLGAGITRLVGRGAPTEADTRH